MEIKKLKNILEAVLLAADRCLTVVQLEALFELDEERPTRDEVRQALHEMTEDYADRGYELNEVASGYRLQVRQDYATWVGRLWEEKPARYTRALLETMALIAYRQPITRGEIEEVRGVSVSSNIIKTLLERDWIKILGHKDVPGKPSLYGTTKEFLDYFNLKTLDELPTLAEIRDLDNIHPELALDEMADQVDDEIDPADVDHKAADNGDDEASSPVAESEASDEEESITAPGSEVAASDAADMDTAEIDPAESKTAEDDMDEEALLEEEELSDHSNSVKSAFNG
jgi:segregation and condensation protein B